MRCSIYDTDRISPERPISPTAIRFDGISKSAKADATASTIDKSELLSVSLKPPITFIYASIEYNDDREIIKLVITNDNGMVLYELKEKSNSVTNNNALSKGQMELLQSELKRTGITMETVQDRYKIVKPEVMGNEIYNKVLSALKKTKSAA